MIKGRRRSEQTTPAWWWYWNEYSIYIESRMHLNTDVQLGGKKLAKVAYLYSYVNNQKDETQTEQCRHDISVPDES